MTTWDDALHNLLKNENKAISHEEIVKRVLEQKWPQQLVKQRLRDLVSRGKIEMIGEQDLNRITNEWVPGTPKPPPVYFRIPL